MTLDGLLAVCFPGVAQLPPPDVSLAVTVAEDDHTNVVAHVGIFWRTLTINGWDRQVCGIGSVATDPEWRGRGLATRLVEQAHQHAAAAGVELAALFADDILARGFYMPRLGYLSSPGWPANLRVARLAPSMSPGIASSTVALPDGQPVW